MKLPREFFSFYYLQFFLSYIAVYFLPSVAPLLSISILLSSYYLIAFKHRFDVVIALIFFSRCLNGFVIPHNKTAFLAINLLSNVFPLFLYLAVVSLRKGARLNTSIFTKYKFTFLLFLLMSASFAINFSTSHDLISKRYLPFAFFILFLVTFTRQEDFKTERMIAFFRSLLLASFVVFLFPDYLTMTRQLMESDAIFSEASDSNAFSLTYFSFTRNMGPTWDHRIIAIISYLYLLLAITSKSKYLKWDIILSLAVVILTLSRGAILTYSFILIAYLIQIGRQRVLITLATIAILLGGLLLLSKSLLTGPASDYLQSFNPTSSDNALDQRSVFARYALNSFVQNPLFGEGVGALTSQLIDRSIVVDNATLGVAGDAFWYILSAEMGAIGVMLFLLLLVEVVLSKNLLFIALFAGFALQLLGTDIPDMRFYYFAILVLIFMAKKQLEQNPKLPSNPKRVE